MRFRIFIGLWFCMMFLTVVGAVVASHLYRRLHSHHREVWERLGRPTSRNVSFNVGPSGQSVRNAVGRFMWRREYLTLDDPTLARLGGLLRRITWLAMGAFIVALAVGFLGGHR
jgi:hypothetical protein